MALKCDTCGREFPTNTSLYLHKRTHNPSLVLMTHDHGDKSPDSGPSDKGKKKTPSGTPKRDPQNEPGLKIIDSWDRKRDRDDSDDGPPPKRKPDQQDDDSLHVIDSYNAPIILKI